MPPGKFWVSLTHLAKTDFEDILIYTERQWGSRQSDLYAAMLDQAINSLSVGADRNHSLEGTESSTGLTPLIVSPVYVNAPVNDSNFRWQSVDRIAAAAGQIYRLYNVPSLLRIDHPDCAHDFPDEQREIAYRWLDRVLR